MEKLFFTIGILVFCFTQITAQTYSLKYFVGGGGFDRFSMSEEPSEIDSLYYPIKTNYNDGERYSFTALTFGIQNANGNFTEIGIGYAQGKSQIIETTNSLEFIQKGNYFGRAIGLDIERYFQYKKLQTEKIKTYWGVGINMIYETAKITAIENSKIYPAKRQRGGIGSSFLTRIIYGAPTKRWKFEGTFGFSIIEFFQDYYDRGDPNLTERQNKNKLLDMNVPLEAFAQFGVSYTFNTGKDEKDK